MKILISLLFVFCSLFVRAQNLVKDNSFEKKVQSITLKQGSPPPLPCENFKSKRPSSVNSKKIHYSYYPKPEAVDGFRYASLLVKSKNSKEYSANAIKLTLCEPLQKDSVYQFSIKVLGEPNVQYSEIPFQVLLCNNCKESEEKGWKNNPSMVQFLPTNELIFSQTWTELKGFYKAFGGEKFVMIYNFKPGKKTKIQNIEHKNEGNYVVYVDDVKLYLNNKNINCLPQKQRKKNVPKFQ
ncbi:MAG: hypothetical protein V4667_03825 [Bacteroidota bacterium]